MTAETNLVALHRGHHNLKTAGFWDSQQSKDGTLTWTTATGRTVMTYPYLYDDPDNLPIQSSHLEQRLGGRLAQVLNPQIPLPGHFNLLDYFDWQQALAPAQPQPRQPRQRTRLRAPTTQNPVMTAGTPATADPPPPF